MFFDLFLYFQENVGTAWIFAVGYSLIFLIPASALVVVSTILVAKAEIRPFVLG